ncbi:Fe-S protein assembly chaperone HscA [Vandammella animalimorsus]|uniref:Chaperone protein HscA homolog n=1 Tax=Vandammella animalimorsus TaxID=2029117 RepID=A0A2A2T8T2_9BURK|nr:Fe-S protein assembly chaperone HscA [Vandammella animalimorsus]PAT33332.1 Fe-S protein assembly chaperone HscA [Vandammella animalimorsus]PAX18428.1 Fe-S protein assembly chaperone HscA [Vandammella animalimorsus]PAX20592.1 Fe-S protein assembly chaperone HscA [Vandammella animalimorsus]
MALMQIAEPNQSPDPHQFKLAVGIDLGTTHSLVAAMRHGSPQCLPDAQGRILLPSAVHYGAQGQRHIGHAALQAGQEDAANTIVSAKRLIGRGLADIANAQQLPYELSERKGEDGRISLYARTAAGEKTPVEVSAEILATLRQRAEDSFDAQLYGAVVTVPAYFDDAQRQATKDAIALAGIRLLRLINEPTAAAIAYGLDHGAEGIYLVYDLGGGTFDASVLRLSKGVFEVLATGGDSALGGDDFDALLVQWASQQLGAEPATSAEKAYARQQARAAKEALAEQDSATLDARWGGRQQQLVLQHDTFAALVQPLVERSLQCVARTLEDAKLSASDVQGTVMVGGSTRMRTVRENVARFLGKPPLTELNPDEVVALGAAIQAHQLAGNARSEDSVLLLDVVPLSLGIEIMGGLTERIIHRNDTIPTAKAQDFTTYQDGQTALAIHVLQGERDMASDNRSLARFELRGIPPMAAGAARIRVTFTVDADGLLSVSAQEQSSGVHAQVQVKPTYGLPDSEIERMLRESFATAEQDIQARALTQARVDARRLILATQSALEQDRDLLSDSAHAAILASIAALQALIDRDSGSAAQIEAAIHTLAHDTEAFAAARMNRGIQQALAGKSVQSL